MLISWLRKSMMLVLDQRLTSKSKGKPTEGILLNYQHGHLWSGRAGGRSNTSQSNLYCAHAMADQTHKQELCYTNSQMRRFSVRLFLLG